MALKQMALYQPHHCPMLQCVLKQPLTGDWDFF